MSSAPGERVLGDDLAPKFAIRVMGELVKGDILHHVRSIEFDEGIGLIASMTIVLANPGFALLANQQEQQLVAETNAVTSDFVSHSVFQPGNEVELLVGYGDKAMYPLGRGIIQRHLPDYPRVGMPTLTLRCYDFGCMMKGVQGQISGATQLITNLQKAGPNKTDQPKIVVGTKRRNVASKTFQGETYIGMRHSDIVRRIAIKYGLRVEIEPTTRPDRLVQRRGEDDYAFIQHLANINSKLFWFSYSDKFQKWTLHWKTPDDHNPMASPRFVFRYRSGDKTSLLEFHPDFNFKETTAKVTGLMLDRKSGEMVSVGEVQQNAGARSPFWHQWGGYRRNDARAFIDESAKLIEKPRRKPGKKPGSGNEGVAFGQAKALGDATRGEAFAKTKAANGKTVTNRKRRYLRNMSKKRKTMYNINQRLKDSSEMALEYGGSARIHFSIRPGRYKDIKQFNEEMLRIEYLYRDAFITARGVVMGNEQLHPRQMHVLEGLGFRLDGFWYFTKVTHRWSVGQPYECEFEARKHIESIDLDAGRETLMRRAFLEKSGQLGLPVEEAVWDYPPEEDAQ